MEPSEVLKRIQNKSELLSWILRLVPPGAGGSDLTRLPPVLEEQLTRIGVTGADPIEKLEKVFRNTDWARNEYERLIQSSSSLRAACDPPGGLAVGTTNDSEFNGHAYPCHTPRGIGYVIVLPIGAMPFVSFAAEMIVLLGSYTLWDTLARGTASLLGWKEPWIIRNYRKLMYWARRGTLIESHGRRLGWQYGMLINRYIELGGADMPDSISELGSTPDLFNIRRIGHPLEAGSNLRTFAHRFLLLHECGHIALKHLGGEDIPVKRRLEQEFEADEFAIRQSIEGSKADQAAIASILGAWLIFTLSGRIDEREGKAESRSTHPSATARVKRLRELVLNSDLVSKSLRMKIFDLLIEIKQLESNLIKQAKEFVPIPRGPYGTTLSRFLRSCAETGETNKFYDQIPRWLLFAAPLRLCEELGMLRADMEQRLSLDPNDAIADKQLQLLIWIFTAGENVQSKSLSQKLAEAYENARSKRRLEKSET